MGATGQTIQNYVKYNDTVWLNLRNQSQDSSGIIAASESWSELVFCWSCLDGSAACIQRPLQSLAGHESSLFSRGRSTKQGSCRESAHRVFVPFHACAEGVVYDRHAFLNSKRLG